MRRHPILAFAILAIAPTWSLQFLILARGWDLMPAKLAELAILLAAAVTVTATRDGRPGVRRLFTAAFRWRFNVVWWAVGLLARPPSAPRRPVVPCARPPTAGSSRPGTAWS
jgi:hypothetical protein